jgi:DNA-binding winged helix-turn-helix (wHTH) protein
MTDPRTPAPATGYRLERFELRPSERLLLRSGEPIRIGGRAFDMLLALAERADRVVGKRELMDVVWPRLVVEENNLQAQIVALRKLLGPAAIATVPGRGYRLTLAVEALRAPRAPDASPESAQPVAAETTKPAPSRHNLPRSVEALIGRDRELSQLQGLVAEHRLITVTGPGGVGKSRLVIDASWASLERFADGVWLVELAALADGGLVPSAITAALGIAVPPPAEPLATLTRQLGERSVLLVLDNCEHVIDAVAATLDAVLSAAPTRTRS